MEPFDCCIIPGIQIGPWQKFLAYTFSPSFTMHFFTCKSCLSFFTLWRSRTLQPISGYTKSNLGLGFLPNKSSAGETPVDVWEVMQHRLSWYSGFPHFPSLNVLTALSAGPFDAWWYEAVRICRILFIFRKSSNSLPTKLLPLSVTTISGSPWVAKAIRNFSVVALEVELVMGNASIHFECESNWMRNIFPRNGPALHLDYGVLKIYAATPKGVMLLPVVSSCSLDTRHIDELSSPNPHPS